MPSLANRGRPGRRSLYVSQVERPRLYDYGTTIHCILRQMKVVARADDADLLPC